MRGKPRNLGIALGAVLAAAILATVGLRAGVSAGPILSECDGRLKSLAIQYVSGADFASSVYAQLLPQLDADVTVHVMCPDRAAYDELAGRIGPVSCTLKCVAVGHPITAWSRDRWVALAGGSGRTMLLVPRGEQAADIWPQREGDQRVAFDLANALAGRAAARRSDLFFDGGDFLADSSTVFVAPAALRRNIQHTVQDRDELIRRLTRALGRRIVLLPDAPDHHVGMFMMVAGGNTVVVGDPSLARGYALPDLPGGPDFSDATQAKFDSAAEAAAAAGYRVVRIPTVPSVDEARVYVTYLNGLIDQSRSGRRIYLPVYDGADALNAAAARVWRDLGYEVRPINVTATYRHFGTLHCLVNMLEKG